MLLLCVVSCGGDDAASPDARLGLDAAGTDVDAVPTDAEVPDAAPTPAAFTLFLNFGGATLMQAAVDNPAMNKSSLITGTKVISAWADTAGIPTIVADVTAALAPYDIDVVTTRPITGNYVMILFGASPTQAGFANGTGAIMPVTCTPLSNVIAFVFNPVTTPHDVARFAIATMGHLHDVPLSNQADDCMCYAAAECNATATAACTIGGADTVMDPAEPCETVAPFDEAARFLAAFGAHP